MSRYLTAALVVGSLLVPAAHADDAKHKSTAGATQASAAMSEGEVRKVDKDAKKITIKHGPLANLDMPPMTMVFQVKDPAMLDKVKAGDKVKFQAEKVDGSFTVTQIEPAK
jgi:Cu(I)/Ag(I) efflux system periplasmic protein CusF